MKKIYLLLSLFFVLQWSQAQIVTIPDANFKYALVSTNCVDTDGNGLSDDDVDTNNDGEIQESEALAITGLRIDNKSIVSLEGIQAFTNLEALYCSHNPIVDLSLTQNVNLKFIICINTDGTSLTNVDISQNINLEGISIIGNLGLTSLDISQNINLKSARIGYCSISNLDISQNSNLENLELFETPITNLNLSQNPNLERLSVYGNSLTNLDVTPVIGLEYLRVFDNQLPSLDISQNLNLKNLDIGQNSVTSIDLTQNANLEILIANQVGLTSIDISQNPMLRSLNLNNNNLTSVDFSQNPNLENVTCNYNQLTTLDLSANPNIVWLYCNNNLLTNIDLGVNPNLRSLDCSGNLLTSLDVTTCSGLQGLVCTYNAIGALDVSQNLALRQLDCYNNLLTTLDVNQNPLLKKIACFNNQLEDIYVRNGVNSAFYEFRYSGNPDLKYVCVDDGELGIMLGSVNLPSAAVVSTFCPLTPGNAYHSVSGITILDTDVNGCDVNDNGFPNMKYNITNSSTLETGIVIANTSGYYTLDLQSDDVFTIVPELENPNYFTVSPTTLTVDTSIASNLTTQDFCITPNGTKNDLGVAIFPLELARPGFDTSYQITYKNKGNTELSGSVQLTFDDAIMDLVTENPMSDVQTANSLTWNYINLAPFETRSITFTMNINSPLEVPAVNDGDILNFEASISPIVADETPDDNVMTLHQGIVNSFDPNDIRCLEGETVTTDYIGKFVHYMIRFENTGTASAVNIAVKNVIDETKFDISTLRPIASSHEMVTNIKNDTEVEFIFENINLPFDDATNDGYIVYKIKTLASLVEGNIFENSAGIYFDFNAPIITNTATTLISNTLNISENDLITDAITIFPNPATTYVQMTTKQPLTQLEIVTLDGKLVLKERFNTVKYLHKQDASFLAEGIYLMRITTKEGTVVKKLVKQ